MRRSYRNLGVVVFALFLEGLYGCSSSNPSSSTLVSISVTPSTAAIAPGSSQQFQATANYSDSSTQNVTALVTWASSSSASATVSSTGLVSAQATYGTSDISASLNGVSSSATLKVGLNLYLADSGNNRIRKVDWSTQTITTIAGTGTSGAAGDAGPATSAQLWEPQGLAIDGSGNIFIGDTQNNRVRVISAITGTILGVPVTVGNLYTLAGNGTAGYTGDGGPATASTVSAPGGVSLDAAGNLYFSDGNNNVIRVIAATSGTLFKMSVTAGNIYTIAGNEAAGSGYSGDVGPATSAKLNTPNAVAVDPSGNLFISDQGNFVVRYLPAVTGSFSDLANNIYTIAGKQSLGTGFGGDGGLATIAQMSQLWGVALDGSGNLFISDTNNNVIRAVANTTGSLFGVSVTQGHIYTVAGKQSLGAGYSGDNGVSTNAQLSGPYNAVADTIGNLFIPDRDNGVIRIVAAQSASLLGISAQAGKIYTVVGNGTGGFSGDNGTALSAELSDPSAIAFSPL